MSPIGASLLREQGSVMPPPPGADALIGRFGHRCQWVHARRGVQIAQLGALPRRDLSDRVAAIRRGPFSGIVLVAQPTLVIGITLRRVFFPVNRPRPGRTCWGWWSSMRYRRARLL
jgi:hypothetical protein